MIRIVPVPYRCDRNRPSFSVHNRVTAVTELDSPYVVTFGLSGPTFETPTPIPHPTEVYVPYADVLEAEISIEPILETVIKPRPESFDSGPEFSLDHLRNLYKLVEAEYGDLDGYVFDDSCLRVA